MEKLLDTTYNTRHKLRKCASCGKMNARNKRIDFEGGSACKKGNCYMQMVEKGTFE